MDPIHVGTAVTATLDITRLLQVAQHPIGMALRDTGSRRNVRDPQVGLLSNSKQNLGVSRDEGPAPSERRLYLTGLTCLCHFAALPRSHVASRIKTSDLYLRFQAPITPRAHL